MKNGDKVVRIPIHWKQREKNRIGRFGVPCQVSGRWIRFRPGSAKMRDGEFLIIEVMTTGQDDRPRKLTEVIVTREDLMEVLERVRPDEPKDSR